MLLADLRLLLSTEYGTQIISFILLEPAITYGGYVNLLKRQLQLSFQFLQARVKSGPLSVVSLILACLTVVYAVLGAVSPEFAYFEEEDDDPVQTVRTRRW